VIVWVLVWCLNSPLIFALSAVRDEAGVMGVGVQLCLKEVGLGTLRMVLAVWEWKVRARQPEGEKIGQNINANISINTSVSSATVEVVTGTGDAVVVASSVMGKIVDSKYLVSAAGFSTSMSANCLSFVSASLSTVAECGVVLGGRFVVLKGIVVLRMDGVCKTRTHYRNTDTNIN
jgi:hypothetical protein